MTPEKGKKYQIKYVAPIGGYIGEGTCVSGPYIDDEYEFILPGEKTPCRFMSEDIVAEIDDDKKPAMRMEYMMPCPFCGGTELTYNTASPRGSLHGIDVSIVCDTCFVAGPSRRLTDNDINDTVAGLPRKALERWNKRADVKPLPNQV